MNVDTLLPTLIELLWCLFVLGFLACCCGWFQDTFDFLSSLFRDLSKPKRKPPVFATEVKGNRRYADILNHLQQTKRRPSASVLRHQKEELRKQEGAKVKLSGAVVKGKLSSEALNRIIVGCQLSPGEQAKAIRLMLRFFPPEVVGHTLSQALLRRGTSFVEMARVQFLRSPYEWELEQALEETGMQPADEAWILGYLPFVSEKMQKRLCKGLNKVGTEASLNALQGIYEHFEEHPNEAWINMKLLQQTLQTIKKKLAGGASGGLSMATEASLEGSLSTAEYQVEGELSLIEEEPPL